MNSIAPALETTRLHLLPPQLEDKTYLSQLWQMEAVQRYMGGVLSSQASEDKMDEIIKNWEQKGMGLWVVFKKEGNERLGLCGIGDFEGKLEVIYKLFPHQFVRNKLGQLCCPQGENQEGFRQYWGAGFATEASFATLNYGFEVLHLESMVGITQELNTASHRVLEKLGMRHLSNFMKWDADQRYYEISQEEWQNQQRDRHA